MYSKTFAAEQGTRINSSTLEGFVVSRGSTVLTKRCQARVIGPLEYCPGQRLEADSGQGWVNLPEGDSKFPSSF
jgi:hypothetical protein